jgi:GNAT superfamily N-acetyltransferase
MNIIKIDHDNRYFREIYIIYKKWLKESSYEINEKEFLNEYLNSFNEDTLPNIYALIINDTLIGMYELSAKDFIDEEKYTPYLSRVFVKEQYRGLGYGKELIEHSITTAKSLNYKKLYLHTHHKNLYEKYGFKFLKEVKTKYGSKKIYELDLKSTN